MRSLQISRFGPPEVLRIVDGPDPEPGPGEVVVTVEASGINFADIMARMGLYPDAGRPPIVPGYEFAGRVAAIGTGVDGLQEGDPVVGLRNFGAHSDRVLARARSLHRRPDGLDAVQAAAFPVTYLTAWHALVYLGNLHPGERVLIHNAGGGLGTAALQIARHRGARVFGTASPGKHEWLLGLGLEAVFDYRDWPRQLREHAGRDGVELILDPIGGRNLQLGFESLAHTGRIVACGTSTFASGWRRRPLHLIRELLRWPRLSPIRMMLKNRGAFGVHLGHLWHREEIMAAQLEELTGLLGSGVLDPVIDRVFPAAEAVAAHRHVQGRCNHGKVVLSW